MESDRKFDFRENEIHIYYDNAINEMDFSFFHNGRNHNMKRPIDDSMAKTCARLAKKFSKEKKVTDVVVAKNGISIDTTILSNKDWTSGLTVSVKGVGTLTTIVNCPVVIALRCFPMRHMRVGSPVVPQLETKHTTKVKYSWFYKRPTDDEYSWISDSDIFWPQHDTEGALIKLYATPLQIQKKEDFTLTDPREISVFDDSLMQEDRVLVGRSVTLYIGHPVEAETPFPRILEVRQDFLSSEISELSDINPQDGSKTRASASLRMMTYNILANAYATNPHAIRDMYDYVPDPEVHLAEEYRSQLVVKELLSSRASVICLQECDKSLYEKYLGPIMEEAGYWSHYTNKTGLVVEGCASFVKKACLNVLRVSDLKYGNMLKSDTSLRPLFDLRPDVEDYVVNKIGSIAQVLLVQSVANPENIIVIGNTHLFYHPHGSHVRLMQGNALLHAMNDIRRDVVDRGISAVLSEGVDVDVDGSSIESECTEGSGITSYAVSKEVLAADISAVLSVSLVLLGDLNSSPRSVLVEYMQSGIIHPTHKAWKCMYLFSWEASENDSPGSRGELTREQEDELHDSIIPHLPTMSHDLNMVNAAGFPEFSNYTNVFKCTLDYIFMEGSKMEVKFVAPFPSEDILSENVALPSVYFPSDHVSLIVDIELLPERVSNSLSESTNR